MGQPRIAEFIESVGGWQYGWEPLKPYVYPLDNRWHAVPSFSSAESMAKWVIQRIIEGRPELIQFLHTEFMMKYARKIMAIYQEPWIYPFSHRFSQFEKSEIGLQLRLRTRSVRRGGPSSELPYCLPTRGEMGMQNALLRAASFAIFR